MNQRLYPELYFQQWPFGVVPEDSPEIWADREALKMTLDDMIHDNSLRGRSSLVGMWGYLGAGKSHSLLYFKNIIQQQGLGYCIYSPIPKELKSFADIYRQAFFRSLNFHDFALAMGRIYSSHSGINEYTLIDLVTRKITMNWLDMGQALVRLGGAVVTGGPLNPYASALNSWLGGTRLSKTELRVLGLSANLSHDGDYVKAAASVIRALTFDDDKSRGYPAVFWMIDDCHYLAELKKSRKAYSSIQQGLREVFDACPRKLCTILAFAARQPGALQDIIVEDLFSRVSERIQVPPLSKDDCLNFIRELLANPRFRSKEAKGEYYPFTEESAKSLPELMASSFDLTPRNLMKALECLVRKAERDSHPKVIGKEFVNQNFAECLKVVTSSNGEM